jgi:protein gp37
MGGSLTLFEVAPTLPLASGKRSTPMADTSAIEWTDATWNPWMGCEKVSPGCAHCYMFREQRQYGSDPSVVRRSKTKFGDPLRWSDSRFVFTCSWSDWFHPGADPWRDEAWQVIRATPHLTYQILTKRPELIPERLPADWGDGYANVWFGVSVENSRFTWRADALRDVPAAVRFVSAEPLLGSLFDASGNREALALDAIDWLIVGGESGPGARRLELEWAFELMRACDEVGTAFFMKQLGTQLGRELGARDKKGRDINSFPSVLRRREMPARKANPAVISRRLESSCTRSVPARRS